MPILFVTWLINRWLMPGVWVGGGGFYVHGGVTIYSCMEHWRLCGICDNELIDNINDMCPGGGGTHIHVQYTHVLQ